MIESPMDYTTMSEQRRPTVHERLTNKESKSLRPFYRRGETNTERPTLYLEGVQQNAIKFTSNENDYPAFLYSNGLLVAHNSG